MLVCHPLLLKRLQCSSDITDIGNHRDLELCALRSVFLLWIFGTNLLYAYCEPMLYFYPVGKLMDATMPTSFLPLLYPYSAYYLLNLPHLATSLPSFGLCSQYPSLVEAYLFTCRPLIRALCYSSAVASILSASDLTSIHHSNRQQVLCAVNIRSCRELCRDSPATWPHWVWPYSNVGVENCAILESPPL